MQRAVNPPVAKGLNFISREYRTQVRQRDFFSLF